MLISHSFLPRSMFNMDSWTRPVSIGFGPSSLDLFDPFDELDQMVGRNLNWLIKPTFFNQQLPEKFRVTLDCAGYKSESVKTEIKDGFLIVVGNEGEHKSNENDDYSVKQFKKTYKLPTNVETNKLASFMTSNGRLVIEIPLRNEESNRSNDLFPKLSEDKKSISMNLLLPKCTDPAKINVTCKDRQLIVKYEDKTEKDDNFSSIYFYKQVLLPENTQFNDLKCKYENNLLSITAPLNTDFKENQANSIPVEFKN
jgi:HSP20 family molecular chaperone IbpA